MKINQRTRIKNELTKYGKQVFFTIENITEIFGFSRTTAYRFVEGLPKVGVNGKNVYFINDILSKIELEGGT